MDLFVRESGPAGAPAIVFLHSGNMSGWSWEPVVERMQQYRCLVPDLPHYGKSFQQGPFEMARAATAVAELIRSRVGTGRAHVVGFSLGAQVGVQLLATEPKLVDRAVLCGTVINTMPWVGRRSCCWGDLPQLGIPLGSAATGMPALRRFPRPRSMSIARTCVSFPADSWLTSSWHLRGSRFPRDSTKRIRPHCSSTGAKETPAVRRWAAALAQQMPNGVDRVAMGMLHDWPLRDPDLFSRTVDGWLTDSALPPEIALPNSGRR